MTALMAYRGTAAAFGGPTAPGAAAGPSWYIAPDATLEDELAIRARRMRELGSTKRSTKAPMSTRQRGASREQRPQAHRGDGHGGSSRDGPRLEEDDDPSRSPDRLVRLRRAVSR